MIEAVGLTNSMFTHSSSDKTESKIATDLLKSSSFTRSGEKLTFEVTVDIASSKYNGDFEIRQSFKTIGMIDKIESEQKQLAVDYMISCLGTIGEMQKKFDTYLKNVQEGCSYLCPDDEKIVRSASIQLNKLSTMITTCTYLEIDNILNMISIINIELQGVCSEDLSIIMESSKLQNIAGMGVVMLTKIEKTLKEMDELKNQAYKMIVIRLKQLML
jgi:hypothetical protein